MQNISIDKPQNNLLLIAASPLLTLLTQIKHTAQQDNVVKLRAQLIQEIKLFNQQLLRCQYQNSLVMAARYCLCTALDEAVLAHTWGTESIWVQESLLSYFHKESWGGENFYVILQNFALQPRRNIDFLELAYCLLSLGFEGKFYNQQASLREEIRNRLFYRIRNSRQKPERRLSEAYEKPAPIVENKIRKKYLTRIALVSVSCLLLSNIVFNVLSMRASKNTFQQLKHVAEVNAVTEFSQLVKRDILYRETDNEHI